MLWTIISEGCAVTILSNITISRDIVTIQRFISKNPACKVEVGEFHFFVPLALCPAVRLFNLFERGGETGSGEVLERSLVSSYFQGCRGLFGTCTYQNRPRNRSIGLNLTLHNHELIQR